MKQLLCYAETKRSGRHDETAQSLIWQVLSVVALKPDMGDHEGFQGFIQMQNKRLSRQKERFPMKKVFALVLSVVMLFSVAALASSPDNDFKVLDYEAEGLVLRIDPDTLLCQQIASAIETVGMSEAFSKVENADEFAVAALGELIVSGADELVDKVFVRLFVPGLLAAQEANVQLGIVVDGNVTWEAVEVVSVEDDVLTVAFTPEQLQDAQANPSVVAVLTK